MKRLLLALLLLPALVLAQAVGPCAIVGPPVSYGDFLSGGAYACTPGPLGQGTTPSIQTNSAGTTVWWYCPQAGGSWQVEWATATFAVLTPAYLSALATALVGVVASPSPVAALNSLMTSNATLPLSDPSLAAAWCPLWPTMYNGAPTHSPSLDGTLVPPTSTIFDSTGGAWTLLLNGFVALNGAQTNGHGVEILYVKGSVYVLSPTGGFWWKWLGLN